MTGIQNQTHNKDTFYYSLSRMLERASYYGLRAVLIFYMTGEVLNMDTTEAFSISSWAVGSLVFSQIIGALLGDLLIGNKKSIIIGGIIQAMGAFSLCIPSTSGLYLGLLLVSLGSGFYTPNIIANFGKLYLNKTRLLDSGFTIFYLAINLGSFLGVLLIGYAGEKYGYTIGFILSGLLMLLSLIPILISKEVKQIETIKNELSIRKRILNISIAFIVVGLFWCIYEISNTRIYDLQVQFSKISALDIPMHLWHSSNTGFVLICSLIAIILWTYLYSSQFFKLMLGFIFGALSFGIIVFIPEIPAEQHAMAYLLSLLLLGFSEIHIAPIIHSILTKYSNPKYLAILISLALLPTKLISLIFGLFNDRFHDNPILGLRFGIIAMTVISIGLIGFVIWNKKTTYNNRLFLLAAFLGSGFFI